MNQNHLNRTAITVFLFFFATLVYSQGNTNSDVKRLLTIKFSAYTVEMDILIQKEFSSESNFRSVYSCIPAGVVVLESKVDAGLNEKTEVEKRVKSLNKNVNYEVLLGISISEAEKSCSSKRKLDN
jgi:hypothetical protein